MDAVDGGCDCGILVRDVLALDEVRRQASVRRDKQLADVGKLSTSLRNSNLLAVEVLDHHTLENLMRMTVEHDVDTTRIVHQTMRAESHRLGRLTHM